jgi:hypothetical protein
VGRGLFRFCASTREHAAFLSLFAVIEGTLRPSPRYRIRENMLMRRSMLIRATAMVASAFTCGLALAAPLYTITLLGPVTNGTAASGQGISASGAFATGFSNISSAGGGGSRALLYTAATGVTTVQLNLVTPVRNFSRGAAVNDAGTIAGLGATTSFGSSPIPLLWKNGTATTLPLPSGQTAGRVFGLNNAEQAVGSVGGGVSEFATVFTVGGPTVLNQTTPAGGRLVTAYGINGAGRIVGQALDPNNAAVTLGWYLDPNDTTATVIPPVAGDNSTIAFAVSSTGFVAGSSSLNSGANAKPFLWTAATGTVAVPLPAGASSGGARGVNKDGWVVGTASSAFALPYLFDGTSTHLLQDLLVNPAGWNLTTNTSSAALGIADNGAIVGQGVFNGAISGFVMTPIPEPGGVLVLVGAVGILIRRR